MTSSTSTDWIREGAEVAEYRDRLGFGPDITPATIMKLTKTQIVLDNGNRYNRATRQSIGGVRRYDLLPANDPRVLHGQDHTTITELFAKADNLYRELRNGQVEMYDALDTIEQAVREARAAIDRTTPRDRLARQLYVTDLGAALRRSGEEEWDNGTAKPDDVQDCYARADVLIAAMTGKEA